MTERMPDVWPWWKRGLFHVVAVYWLLYCLPARGRSSALALLPQAANWFGGILGWPVKMLSLLVGRWVFHLSGEEATWHVTGSGDTALDYVAVLVMAVLAVIAGGAWSAVCEMQRPPHRDERTVYAWLRLLLRFTLAMAMIGYGLAKIFPQQFSAGLSAHELQRTYGESSPMGLLWSFMAASRPYAVFGGVLELAAGLLLLMRRTVGLGALLAAAVMTEVAVLNFCYDVPVKLYSTHLLLMAIFLALPELGPMWQFFVLRREAVPRDIHVPRSERRWLRYGRYALATLMVINLAGGAWETHSQYARGDVQPSTGSSLLEARGFHWVQEYPFNR